MGRSQFRAVARTDEFLRVIGLAATALLLGGCTTNHSEDRGFVNVSRDAELRSGASLQWSHDDTSAREIGARVDLLLRNQVTCDQAIQVALLNNQNLQASYEELGISQAQVIEAGQLKNPTLSAELRFPRYTALPFEVDLVQSFLDALMIPVRKQLAGADYLATQGRVTAEVLNLAADVRVAFYRAQAAAQIVELREKIVQGTSASLDAARRMHDAGNITDLSLLTQQTLDVQSRMDLSASSGELRESRHILGALLGLAGEQAHWSIANHLPDLPEAEIEPGGLESMAIRQRADLQSQGAQLQVAISALELSRKTAGLSEITVGGKVVQDPDGDLTAGPSVSIPLPIFNQGQAALMAANARVAQARKRYAALAVQIRSDVGRDRDRLLSARERAAYFARVLLPLRQQIVQQTQLQSNAMIVGLFELLAAKQNEIDAAREWIEALRDYWIARAELERAVGGRLSGGSPATQPSTQPTSTDATQEPSQSMPMDMPHHITTGAHP